MMVSVIICFYKEYLYIEQALLSLKFQIYKNFEIILIDDSGLTNNLELENILKKFKELNTVALEILRACFFKIAITSSAERCSPELEIML